MTTRTLLLALHIAGAAAWLGANFVQLVLNPRFGRDEPAAQLAWTRHQLWLGERYYGPVGGLIALTGVLLVLDGDWSWGSGFVWVGIAVVALGGVLGVTAFAPLTRTRVQALEQGDEVAAATAQRRTVALALLDTALVLLAVLAMVHKWQA